MRFGEWLCSENVLYDDEQYEIRDAAPNDIPRYFLHLTDNQSDIDGIIQSGFNLRLFGRTGKKFNMPSMVEFDPRGVYASAIDDPNSISPNRPFVIFTAAIRKAIIATDKHSPVSAKEILSRFFGGLTGAALSNRLKSLGYQAVLSPNSEQIILDPSIIQVIRHSSNA